MSEYRPNVLIIVIDALRARNLGCYSNRDGLSPNIDRFAQESVLFEDNYSTWNTTDQSLTTILSGRYPRSHGIINHGDAVTEQDLRNFERSGTRMLAEILGERDYHTIAVDWMARWFKLGFQYYGYPPAGGLAKKIHLYLKYMLNHIEIFRCYAGLDQDAGDSSLIEDVKGVLSTFLFSRHLAEVQDARYVTNAGLDLLDDSDCENFFLFLHYWDVHTPYNCPRRYKTYHGSDPEKRLLDRYEGAVRYVDEQLGRLFEEMEERGVLDNTMVIVTSDHGESLMEHDIYFDHHGLYEVTTHCPLLIRLPGQIPQGKRLNGFVQHSDLVPTILHAAGIEDEQIDPDGADLFPLIRGEVDSLHPFIYNEETYVQEKRALRTENYRYIEAPDGEGYCRYCHTVHGGPTELYDLQQDPQELINLVPEKPDLADELSGKLNRLVDRLQKRLRDSGNGSAGRSDDELLDKDEQEELQQRFKGLGYH
ncbi:MAG: sulfatase [Planctomycetes bacterium]|nr:sulfatase [Planctomycetota bacterium]